MGGIYTRAAWAGAVLAALTSVAPKTALADSVSDAKDIFVRARQLRAHGDCGSAIPLFAQANDLYPAGLGSLRNLAECQEAVQKFSSARQSWIELKRRVHGTTDPKYQGWDADADQAAARLEPKASGLVVALAVIDGNGQPAPADGVQVTLDGQALAPNLLGTRLERDAGHYELHVSGEKLLDSVDESVDLAPGQSQQVELHARLKAEPPPAAPPASIAVVPPPPPSDGGRRARRSLGWVALGMGVAGAVGAGVSFGVRQVAQSSLERSCPNYRTGCNADLESTLQPTLNAGHVASTLVTVFGVVGVVGLAGGVVLLATTPSRPVEASLFLTPGGLSLGGRFE